MTLQITSAGSTSAGAAVQRASIRNAHGIAVSILSFGGIIASLDAPDRDGRLANIVLGYADLAGYETHNGTTHFGALIGRYANRIAHGRFSLDGADYRLPLNNGPNSLHGGPDGFGRRVWMMTPQEATQGGDGVRLSLSSPDGEAGYPGRLDAEVTYRLTDADELEIDYVARCDAPTVVNLTNHSYFNLAGEAGGCIEGHVVQIEADHFTPVDASLIPTGRLAPVAGTPLDFRTPTAIGDRLRVGHEQMALGRGYDHNWALRGEPGSLRRAVTVHDPVSGRALTCLTTQPGLQFYSGNFLDGTLAGTSGTLYRQGDGLCLETQHFPDSPNQPDFPSTVLRPGQTYRERTVFRLHSL
ncbi:aldose epimerase family protein [Lichenicoccus sp.]|uniref:aldose epimerase family protein n=1 Tax=Lichenicoccus sp. TaxID=2781899 RepID=UPI003D1302A4